MSLLPCLQKKVKNLDFCTIYVVALPNPSLFIFWAYRKQILFRLISIVLNANEYPSGFDLNRCDVEQKVCRNCGEKLVGDGHNIPVEFFAGYDGNKVPDFDFNFASEIQQNMVEYLEDVFDKDKTFYAGTKGTFSYRRAEHLIEYYCREHDVQISPAERNVIKNRISNAFKTNGRHPGGIVVVPSEKDIYDFTPIGYDTDYQLRKNMKPATLIEYHKLTLDKFDILGHTMFSKLKLMEELTGISARSIDFKTIKPFRRCLQFSLH